MLLHNYLHDVLIFTDLCHIVDQEICLINKEQGLSYALAVACTHGQNIDVTADHE